MDLRVILKGILFSTHLSAFKIEAGCTLPLGCDATGSSPWKHTTGNDGTVVRFLFRKEGGHCWRSASQKSKILKKTFESQSIFVNGTMKPAGSRAVVARTMAGMMEEVTDCGSSCRVHIFRRVPRAAATCLISARVELPSLHPPPHGLPLAAAAARPGPAASTIPCSLLPPLDI